MMRALVTWGSKQGGTEGIARIVAEALQARGVEVVAAPAEAAPELAAFDAVVVGGALYANRWPAPVRRFVERNVKQLRQVPVWFFSSGPLDGSADHTEIPPPTQIAVLAERVGVKGHVTFGGYLAPDARGMAGAMAKTHAGDWRNPERVRAWAAELAREMPRATPGVAREPAARSLGRLIVHGLFASSVSALAMIGLAHLMAPTAALVIRACLVPIVFALVARHYFGARGARNALPVAGAVTTMAATLDLAVIAILLELGLHPYVSITAAWIPLALVFLVTWGIGALMSTMPWPKSTPARPAT